MGAGGEAEGFGAAPGRPPSPPTPQCSADPPPPSATPSPSANQSSATRSAPSLATTAATASPRAAPPSSAAVRMGFGNGPSSPAAPVSIQPPASPHLPSWMALQCGSLLPVSPPRAGSALRGLSELSPSQDGWGCHRDGSAALEGKRCPGGCLPSACFISVQRNPNN